MSKMTVIMGGIASGKSTQACVRVHDGEVVVISMSLAECFSDKTFVASKYKGGDEVVKDLSTAHDLIEVHKNKKFTHHIPTEYVQLLEMSKIKSDKSVIVDGLEGIVQLLKDSYAKDGQLALQNYNTITTLVRQLLTNFIINYKEVIVTMNTYKEGEDWFYNVNAASATWLISNSNRKIYISTSLNKDQTRVAYKLTDNPTLVMLRKATIPYYIQDISKITEKGQ
jgi:adenosyl cobinamide kinase/adenosyl cobinamide phosphate guanylyltransferase